MATIAYGPRYGLLDNAAIGQKYYDQMRLFLQSVDSLVFPSSINTTQVVPPTNPNPGDQYLLLSTPSGVWTGYQNYLVYWNAQATNTGTNTLNPSWLFIAPKSGMLIWDIATATLYLYSGGAWAPFQGGVSYPISVADGGTGSTTASAAITALGAAASGANSDITSLTAIGADGITIGSAGGINMTGGGSVNVGSGGVDAGGGTFGGILVSGTAVISTMECGTVSTPTTIVTTGGPALKVEVGVQVVGYTQALQGSSGPTTISPEAGAGSGATASLATGSTDMAGSFTITTGSGPTANSTQATVAFGNNYPSANWFISITPTNANSAELPIYITSKATTGFSIDTSTTATSDTTDYTYDYQIIQGAV